MLKRPDHEVPCQQEAYLGGSQTKSTAEKQTQSLQILLQGELVLPRLRWEKVEIQRHHTLLLEQEDDLLCPNHLHPYPRGLSWPVEDPCLLDNLQGGAESQQQSALELGRVEKARKACRKKDQEMGLVSLLWAVLGTARESQRLLASSDGLIQREIA